MSPCTGAAGCGASASDVSDVSEASPRRLCLAASVSMASAASSAAASPSGSLTACVSSSAINSWGEASRSLSSPSEFRLLKSLRPKRPHRIERSVRLRGDLFHHNRLPLLGLGDFRFFLNGLCKLRISSSSPSSSGATFDREYLASDSPGSTEKSSTTPVGGGALARSGMGFHGAAPHLRRVSAREDPLDRMCRTGIRWTRISNPESLGPGCDACGTSATVAAIVFAFGPRRAAPLPWFRRRLRLRALSARQVLPSAH